MADLMSVGVKAGGYDDAIHGSADGQVTLCDLDATTRNIVTPDEVPDWDVGGAWCWTCLDRRPADSSAHSPTETSRPDEQ